eukprot:jgi/Orpsp1_1/1175954/evm.model.c7180000055855.1
MPTDIIPYFFHGIEYQLRTSKMSSDICRIIGNVGYIKEWRYRTISCEREAIHLATLVSEYNDAVASGLIYNHYSCNYDTILFSPVNLIVIESRSSNTITPSDLIKHSKKRKSNLMKYFINAADKSNSLDIVKGYNLKYLTFRCLTQSEAANDADELNDVMENKTIITLSYRDILDSWNHFDQYMIHFIRILSNNDDKATPDNADSTNELDASTLYEGARGFYGMYSMIRETILKKYENGSLSDDEKENIDIAAYVLNI